ncbi:MAG TPA: TonB-dependent receptor, partial [Steroidobacteraceae bacterium]|nr:TonB-dependent receptor [Steroidobacteraceae bacterium]
IVRSGATSIPEALRLAPNLQVTQLSASSYTIAARGLSGNPLAQSFSNKLLMLIDGRAVYTPLYSGIYIDAQDVLLEDVDRIEVISGPGATLWGSNAVNGVINIVTRPSYLSEGTLLSVAAGNQEQDADVRLGGKLDDETTYRVYTLAFERDALQSATEGSAQDDWWKTQGGFRLDWSRAENTVTVQADAYRALEDQPGAAAGDLLVTGANLLGRWQHHAEGSELQVQAYDDMSERSEPFGGLGFVLHTYDLELQDTIALGSRDSVIWGAGERLYDYAIRNTFPLSFEPAARHLTLSNFFAQDTLDLGAALRLIGGLKLEDDPYIGWQWQPNVRLAWNVSATEMLWASAARAIRSATPFDEDVIERVGAEVALLGNRDFRPERLTAYELGYRGQPARTLSFSLNFFYNVYDQLRSVDFVSPASFFPLTWDNELEGHTYGVEGWATWQLASWWQLKPGFRTLQRHLVFAPGASALLGTTQDGDDPDNEERLTSSMDLPHQLTFDAVLRHVGALPAPALPSYTDLDARLAWHASTSLDLFVNGANLLHARHLEFPLAFGGEYVPRSAQVGLTWRP